MSWDEARELLRIDDGRLWLLVGLCVVLVFTIQAVEASVEGAWPHLRRPARLAPGARAVHGVWAYVALLLLPGLLLGVLNLAVLLWRDDAYTEAHLLGGFFVGLAWLRGVRRRVTAGRWPIADSDELIPPCTPMPGTSRSICPEGRRARC